MPFPVERLEHRRVPFSAYAIPASRERLQQFLAHIVDIFVSQARVDRQAQDRIHKLVGYRIRLLAAGPPCKGWMAMERHAIIDAGLDTSLRQPLPHSIPLLDAQRKQRPGRFLLPQDT